MFELSSYCLHVLCYSHCILTSLFCRDVFYTHNNNNYYYYHRVIDSSEDFITFFVWMHVAEGYHLQETGVYLVHENNEIKASRAAKYRS